MDLTGNVPLLSIFYTNLIFFGKFFTEPQNRTPYDSIVVIQCDIHLSRFTGTRSTNISEEES